jgi:hypothetical protein
MKVARKYIPLPVRVVVAANQLSQCRDPVDQYVLDSLKARPVNLGSALKAILRALFGDTKFELHHRPALVNRPWNARKKDYEPPANDPAHLFYLPKDDHKVETLVRGENGQLSDAGLRRKNKRMAKNRGMIVGDMITWATWDFSGKIVATSKSRAKAKPPKRKWASRPFPKGRKMRSGK